MNLPTNWVFDRDVDEETKAYRSQEGLLVLRSETKYYGEEWVHVSVSRRSRLPSWTELKAVKNIFIGPDKLAIQVLPPVSKFVNLHPFVLHLWHCPGRNPIPDFQVIPGMI